MKRLERAFFVSNLVLFVTAGVLLLASAGKLADLAQAREQPAWNLVAAVLEAGSVALLWRASTRRLGAWLTSALGALFLSYQVWSKVVGGPDCHCLGALALGGSSGSLAVAALALTGGVLLLRLPLQPADSFLRPRLRLGRQHGSFALILSILALAWFRGEGLAQPAVMDKRAPSINLRVGDLAPVVTLPQPTGRNEILGGVAPQWRLYAFLQHGCDSCSQLEKQMDSFCRVQPQVRQVRIVAGRPAFGLLPTRFSQNQQFDTLYDRDGMAARAYCDRPARWPFAVLVSPQGRVRTIADGYSPDDSLSQHLSDVMLREPGSARLANKSEGRSNSKSAPVLLTFIQQGCFACEDFHQTLERVAPNNPSEGVPPLVRRSYVILAGNPSYGTGIVGEKAHALAQRFGVTATPTTLLLGPKESVLLRVNGAVDAGTFQDLLEAKIR